jgi:hypothetical protein
MDRYQTAARRGLARFLIASALAGLLAAALGSAVSAAQPEIPGNNGTVKIHEGANEPRAEVRNEPHVCTFHLHFFFADAGDVGSWEIQEWSPGDKGTVMLDGSYETDANGEDRDPDAGVYSLPDGHYKLFWDGDLDTAKHDKHKVFWVDCEEQGGVAPATPTPTPAGGGGAATPTPTPAGGGGVTTPTPTPIGGVGPIEGTPAPTPGGAVGGLVATPAATLPPTDGIEGARPTSSGPTIPLLLLLAIIAMALLATVPAASITRRRDR